VMNIHSPFLRHNRFILYPNRITCTDFKVRKESFVTEYFRKEIERMYINNEVINERKERMLAVKSIKKYSYQLSKHSQNQLKQSIQSLYYLSPKRKQKINEQSYYQNYKASFITL